MKFFKQTKETKRKISFFMALAMVISLLPVSPVVKAATSNTSDVYLSVDTESAKYVKMDKALHSDGAATASVIIAPESGVTITDVTPVGNNMEVKAAAVTLGSISLEKDKVKTSASVVLREKTGNTGSKVASVSSSSLASGVIAKASLTATGPSIASKNITGAVISIDGIASNKNIEVAIVMESGEPEENPGTESDFTVNYKGTIANADIKVSLSGKEFTSGSKVKATDTLDITIAPKKGYYFENDKLPNITLKDTKSATLNKLGVIKDAYKATVSRFTADTEITISGTVKKADIVNETKPEENIGGATLDTESIQNVKTDIENTFKESDKVTAASAAAVKKALDDNGTIGVSLSVTDAGIVAADKEKGKNAIVSDDKKAKERAVALNISLTAICRDKNNNEVARVEVNELTKEVKVTIKANEIFKDNFSDTPADGYTRKYFVIRVHDGKTEKIECKFVDGNIEFSSKLFSTYVFYYEDVKENQGGNNGGSTGGGSGMGSYVPSGTSTPAPTATPSATPGASATPDASATPSTEPSASPSEPGTNVPGESSKPDTTAAPGGNGGDDKNTGNNAVKVKVGKKVTVNSSKYKVTSVSGTRAVQFTSGKKNAKNVVIPATVKISGKNYKVTSIANNAFKNNKKLKKVTIGVNVNKIGKAAFKGCKNLKSITVKTKKLTAKKVGANAFKGINKKATFKVPKNKVKAYKKIVKAKGAAKTVKVKK